MNSLSAICGQSGCLPQSFYEFSIIIYKKAQNHSFLVVPGFCNCCGKDLFDVPETLIKSRQFIDIPVIKPVCIEHRIYRKTCTCGHGMESNFPSGLTAKVQYGPNVESLTGYLHARQYLPYERMKEFFKDVMCLPVSVGGINIILKRLTKKAKPHDEQIKERISKSILVGTDETGVRINGEKDWVWTWQNDDLTFITHSGNRGFKTIEIILLTATKLNFTSRQVCLSF